jgi:hypothetical protein
MMQKELLTKKDYSAIGEEITLEMASDFVTAYGQARPGAIAGHTIGRNIIDQILSQPGCVGMRFYNALNENGRETLVYVGIDASGNDIVKRVVVELGGELVASSGIIADRDDPLTEFVRWITGK